jgi:hypothetical protein
MAKYGVTWTYTAYRTMTVEANSMRQAVKTAMKAEENGQPWSSEEVVDDFPFKAELIKD